VKLRTATGWTPTFRIEQTLTDMLNSNREELARAQAGHPASS
jgi:hypothetical protein